jgi:hypothetical protein
MSKGHSINQGNYHLLPIRRGVYLMALGVDGGGIGFGWCGIAAVVIVILLLIALGLVF